MPATELTLDAASHSADAVQRAAYKFIDRFALELVSDGPLLRCLLHPLDEQATVDQATVSAFRNEVLDQVLRERIRNETEGVRNLVLSLAFSNTGLNSDEREDAPSPSADDG